MFKNIAIATAVEEHLWPKGFSRDVWMIVDAARDRRIYPMLREFHFEYQCLYAGALPLELELAAPYLIRLDYDNGKTRGFLQDAWGNSWGIFLKCDAHANDLRKHLRRFLVVHDSAGTRLVFRYYDPRVLRIYLPTCTQDELSTVFGPIERFWMEDEEANNILSYSFDQKQLVSGKFSLQGGA